MMRDALLEILAEKGLLISPEALDYIESKSDGVDAVRSALMDVSPGFLGMDKVRSLFERNLAEIAEKREVEPEDMVQIPKIKAEKAGIKVIKDITGESRSTAKVESFVSTFTSRYRKIRRMFRGNMRLKNIRNISSIPKNSRDEVSFVGMVRDFRETKKGYMATLEDPGGEISVFLNKEVLREPLILDEVVGVRGTVSSRGKDRIVFARDIVWPDIPMHEVNFADEPVSAAFISDIHVGSNTFLKDSWEKFIEWLKRPGDSAKRIKYLVIGGDVVDGVGIYPNQEKDLDISDIYSQYETLAGMLEEIPDRISVIVSPGNHDFVRPAEPQPAFDDEIKRLFSDKVRFIGSPACIELSGVKVLVYHGTSITDFISALPDVSYEDPTQALIRMLKSRILAPVYGGSTPLAPEKEDYMVIDDIPDIFITGHVHSYVLSRYRGIIVINASTWQSQTEYQKMNNFKPSPGVVTVVELDTGKPFAKHFY